MFCALQSIRDFVDWVMVLTINDILNIIVAGRMIEMCPVVRIQYFIGVAVICCMSLQVVFSS